MVSITISTLDDLLIIETNIIMFKLTQIAKLATIAIFGLFLLSNNLRAQVITYEETRSPDFLRSSRNNLIYEKYVAKDGTTLMRGSKLKSGDPTDDRVVTKQLGMLSNKIVSDKEFSYYYEGREKLVDGFMTGIKKMKPSGRNEDIIIFEIKAVKGTGIQSGRMLIQIIAIVEGTNQYRTIKDLELALEVGEIINLDRPLTRDEAIAKLKEAKDLMDLGLITEAEYNKLREELTPIIMGNRQ
jgi:hypothetical protein